ncbi:MAG: hypothetical protein JWQ09_2365 [Segetibacter sp.]|nr:hypothetical protein [Segetibacter sp.]
MVFIFFIYDAGTGFHSIIVAACPVSLSGSHYVHRQSKEQLQVYFACLIIFKPDMLLTNIPCAAACKQNVQVCDATMIHIDNKAWLKKK